MKPTNMYDSVYNMFTVKGFPTIDWSFLKFFAPIPAAQAVELAQDATEYVGAVVEEKRAEIDETKAKTEKVNAETNAIAHAPAAPATPAAPAEAPAEAPEATEPVAAPEATEPVAEATGQGGGGFTKEECSFFLASHSKYPILFSRQKEEPSIRLAISSACFSFSVSWAQYICSYMMYR